MNNKNKQHSSDVVIVGAGVIGLACAHYLTAEGLQVTVIDKGTVGSGCSSGNCGYICPSHILPLTEPGVIQEGIKSLFDPKAAFRIKPQFRLSFFSWLYQFAMRCNHKKMMESAHKLNQILQLSRQEYQTLFKQPALDGQWKESGLLYVFETEKGIKEFQETDQLLREHFSCGAKLLTSDELAQFDSALKPDLAGAYFYKNDASLRPDKFIIDWTVFLKDQGVEFIEHCELESVQKSQRRVTSLKTSKGQFSASKYVFAMGAWSQFLSSELECKIPVEPAKGYSVTVNKPEQSPHTPMLFPEHRVGITPFDDGFRLGSMMEFVGFDDSISKQRIDQLFESAKPYLKTDITPSYEKSWTGWRPMTWDSLPIIGYTPKLDNALLATGHNMLGMTLAPATGKLLSSLVLGQKSELDIQSYSPNRFL